MMDNVLFSWVGRDNDERAISMVKGLDRQTEIALIAEESFRGVAYLQSWDIYIWGEPNESSLLLVNSR